jgi:hypothetical protein
MANQVNVYGELALSAPLSYTYSLTDFPVNPSPRTLIVKDGMPYMYTELTPGSGFYSWMPIGVKHANYIHTQGTPSTIWTVSHGLNTRDFIYFIYDQDHKQIFANVNIIDENTVTVILSSATTGTAIFFTADAHSAPIVNTSGGGSGSVDMTAINAALDTKVDRIQGKGLSKNDYTNADKTLLVDTASSVDQIAQNVSSMQLQLNSQEASLTESVATAEADVAKEVADRIAADATNLAAAKTYTDGKITIEVTARNVADATTLASAKTYADAAIANANQTAVNSAVDLAAALAATYTNGQITDVRLDLTNSISSVRKTISDDYVSKNTASDTTKAINSRIDDVEKNASTEVDTKVASSLVTAKSYTDSSISTLHTAVTAEINNAAINSAGVAGAAILAKAATDSTAYTDSKIAAERATASGELATANTSLLTDAATAATTYTDSKIATEVAARTAGDATTLASAKTYADAAVANANQSSIDSAVDLAAALAATYTDGKITDVRLDLNNSNSAIRKTISDDYVSKNTASDTTKAINTRIDGVDDTISALSATVNANALAATAYTDNAITSAISGDTQLARAKSYTDTQDQVILGQAHTYADSAATGAKNAAIVSAQNLITAEATRADTAEKALGVRIDNIISNTDPAALDSLVEIVAAFETADANLNNAITALGATGASSAKDYTDTKFNSLALVAKSGSYIDLANKPTLFSGAYADLTGKPADYSLPTASTTTLGGVKVDGTTVTITAGVLSAVSNLSAATSYTDTAVNNEQTARMTADATNLAAAKTYTDGKITDEAQARIDGDAATLTSSKAYTDSSVNAATSSISTQLNSVITSTNSSTATSVNAYTDNKVGLEATARAAGDATTLTSAKAYTDSAITDAAGGSKTWTYNGTISAFVGTIPWIVAPASLAVTSVLAYLGAASTSGDVTISVTKNAAAVATLTIPQASTYVVIPTSFTAVQGDKILISITAPGLNASNMQLVFIYH